MAYSHTATPSSMNHGAERLRVLAAGVISLVLLIGVARFSYTPLLPLMQEQAGLGVAAAGWLAAVNYFGYLSGAIVTSLITSLTFKDALYRWGLLAAVASTAVMAMTDNVWIWAVSRYVAGLSSAAGMLLGSGLILNWLMRHNFRGELGIHFSGVGIGMMFSALVVELATGYLDWRQQWWVFTLAGALLLIPAWRWLPRPNTTTVPGKQTTMADQPPSGLFLKLFMLAYFCAGIGYVVSATFIVAIIDDLPGLGGMGSWTFFIIGLAAAPASILWDLVARRIGDYIALFLTLALQAIGILLPLLSPGLATAALGAFFFGSTFIGSVSLVLTIAGRYYPTKPAKMMGKMTITYGIAQILAPAITGLLAAKDGNYNAGLYLAAGAVLMGSVMVLQLGHMDRKQKNAD